MSVSKSTGLRVMKSKRFRFKISSLMVYAGTLFVLVALAASGYKSPNINAEDDTIEVAAVDQSTMMPGVATPLTTMDDVKATNLAANVALTTDLSVANSVYNQSISMSTSADLGQYDATIISKTQIIDPTAMSVLGTYTVVKGDTVSTIAKKFGVSAQTIRWANNLAGDNVIIGSTVIVPVVDGVVYTVKAGDNLNTIATKYKSNIDSIVTVNDLDETSIVADTKLLLPDGILPENERPGYQAPIRNTGGSGSTTTMYVPVSNGNRYAYGYCTWYTYNRRMQIGRPIPSNLGNANTWDDRARAAGYLVNRTPAVGAVIQSDSGALGHVGVVEIVNPDGSIVISEMNNRAYGGWNKINTRTIYNPGDYNYIH
ncbi:LysM peptidoglycan-binding domain-containing protein [Candidatus Saccharibacteria bacterium]|nr:LysM peptidoglycan-binding domain-containing protein [Candidatus Saccharibacteria bacterium]